MEEAISKAGVIIEALPYIRSFRRKFVVIKLGGSAMDDEKALRSVIRDVVFMEHVSLWPVLVHGGGKAISAEMEREGIEPEFVQGQRVTTPRTMRIVARVLIEEVSAKICRLIDEEGGKAMPLNGRGSSFLLGRKRTLPDAPDADLGLVGEVTRVDKEACYRLCDGGLIPVVAPIARLDPGEPVPPVLTESEEGDEGAATHPGVWLLNINGDPAASAIARGLGAEKVVFLSDVPGVLADPGDDSSLISSIDRDDVDDLVKGGVISKGMLPKVRSCVEAVEGGVTKAHIVSALLPHALLLEMFTDRGVGTELIA